MTRHDRLARRIRRLLPLTRTAWRRHARLLLRITIDQIRRTR